MCDLLTKARNEIIAASREHQSDADKDFEDKKAERELNELRERIANTTVVEPSHPITEPVTYEEAVEDIWPNTKSAPALRVPIDDEDQVVAVESEYPLNSIIQEGMSFDEAANEVWPQLLNPAPVPVKKAAPVDKNFLHSCK